MPSKNANPDEDHADSPDELLTWAGMLAYWTRLARASLSLPDSPDGRAMKRALPDVIALQSLTLSLRELHRLDSDERRLGLDRSAVLIGRHTQHLREAWRGAELPSALTELIDDAHAALDRAQKRHDADPDAPADGPPGNKPPPAGNPTDPR